MLLRLAPVSIRAGTGSITGADGAGVGTGYAPIVTKMVGPKRTKVSAGDGLSLPTFGKPHSTLATGGPRAKVGEMRGRHRVRLLPDLSDEVRTATILGDGLLRSLV